MADNCHNRLEITGPQARQCLDAIRSGDRVIDFNRIEPMPEILRGTEKYEETACGLLLFGRPDTTQTETIPDAPALAARSLQAEAETGYANWYDWCMANWATKWPAYHTFLEVEQDGHAAIKFDTAASPPLQAIYTLSTQWAGLLFVCTYDEFAACMSGDLTIQNGVGRWLQYELECLAMEEEYSYKYRRGKVTVDKKVPEGTERKEPNPHPIP